MLSWPADEALNELIRRYYSGEAGLWSTICQRVNDELRGRGIEHGAYHIRLRANASGGYDVLIDDASEYANQ